MTATQHGSAAMLGKLLPELSVCASLLWLLLAPAGRWAPEPQAVVLALAVEGASLMFFCTLVDTASRVRRRPPAWLALAIVVGALLMYPDLLSLLKVAWSAGLWIFLPIVWSLLERLRELWTLPLAPKEEKIRRRTLTFDRLWVGLLVAGATIAVLIAVVLLSEAGVQALFHPALLIGVGLAFYVPAAFNAWRVHRPTFTTHPTSLLPWMDRGEGADLAAL